jgi:hypothetical protein
MSLVNDRKVEGLNAMPAELALPFKQQDFGTSRWQLLDKPTSLARLAEAEGRCPFLASDIHRFSAGYVDLPQPVY